MIAVTTLKLQDYVCENKWKTPVHTVLQASSLPHTPKYFKVLCNYKVAQVSCHRASSSRVRRILERLEHTTVIIGTIIAWRGHQPAGPYLIFIHLSLSM
jgi:hypothetical protein